MFAWGSAPQLAAELRLHTKQFSIKTVLQSKRISSASSPPHNPLALRGLAPIKHFAPLGKTLVLGSEPFFFLEAGSFLLLMGCREVLSVLLVFNLSKTL